MKAFPGVIFKVIISSQTEDMALEVLEEGKRLAKEELMKRYINSQIVKKHMEELGSYQHLYLPESQFVLTRQGTMAWVI